MANISVLAGSLLGSVVAWFSYRLYYPPLSDEHAHEPYSPRVLDTPDYLEEEGYGREELDGANKTHDGGGNGSSPFGLSRTNDATGNLNINASYSQNTARGQF